MPRETKRKSIQSHSAPRPNPVARVVPGRRTFVLLESGLILGLAEGIMWKFITSLALSNYFKAVLLMAGVVGAFALAVRVLEPVIAAVLKFIAKLDRGGGALARIGLHAVILFLIFVGYVRVFFRAG
jgi:hypothetical protein